MPGPEPDRAKIMEWNAAVAGVISVFADRAAAFGSEVARYCSWAPLWTVLLESKKKYRNISAFSYFLGG